MLDIQIVLNTNAKTPTDKKSSLSNDKNSSDSTDNFAKLLDDVKNSYDSSKEVADEKETNENESIIDKIKNIFSENKKNNKEDENKNAEELPLSVAQLLFNSQTNNEQNDELQNCDITQNLSAEKQQTIDLMTKLLSELQNTKNVFKTQNPLQTNETFNADTELKLEITDKNAEKIAAIAKDDNIQIKLTDLNKQNNLLNNVDTQKSETDKSSDSILVKADALSEERNVDAVKNEDKISDKLQNDISSDDIEITNVSSDNDLSDNNDTGYNFNSSDINSLSSHLTKLNMNKSSDFSNVLNDKISKNANVTNTVKISDPQPINQTSSVNIVIKPENLGRVNVNLTSSNGTVSAQFIAESQQAADTLNKNLEELKQNLIDQGVKLGEVNIKVAKAAQSEAFDNDRQFKDDFSAFQQNHFRKNNSHANTENGFSNSGNFQDDNYEENVSTAFEDNSENENNYTNTTIYNRNKNLEIYNNMGRTL